MAAFVNRNLFVCGGQGVPTCWYYHDHVRRWDYIVNMDRPRLFATSVLISPNQWWIAGGVDGNWQNGQFLSTSIVYNGQTMQYGPMLPYAAFAACAFKVNSTHVFFSGGYDGRSYRSDAYLLNWATQQWTKLDNMRHKRGFHGCNKAGNDIIVVGSFAKDKESDSSEIYSLANTVWWEGPDLPEEIGTLANIGAATLYLPEEDTFAIFGGIDKNGESKKILKYVSTSNQWKIMQESLALARSSHSVVQVPDDIRTKIVHTHH